MDAIRTLEAELRNFAERLVKAPASPLESWEDKRAVATLLEGARAVVRNLDTMGLEPADFRPESTPWKLAREVEASRRRLMNVLSIAARSLFAAPDPRAMQRDLMRALTAMRRHAELERELLGYAPTSAQRGAA